MMNIQWRVENQKSTNQKSEITKYVQQFFQNSL
jgi:hypothetical protein